MGILVYGISFFFPFNRYVCARVCFIAERSFCILRQQFWLPDFSEVNIAYDGFT